MLGLVLMAAVMITTYFTEAFRMTLVFGIPFLLILTAVYVAFFKPPVGAGLLAKSPRAPG